MLDMKIKSLDQAGQRGVGMIEVMVAVLVLAVGVLGVAAMQAVVLKNTGISAERTQAAIQIYSMMDIVRSDRGNLSAYSTNVYVDPDDWGSAEGTIGGWLGSLRRTVSPDAKGMVVCDQDKMECTVGIQWSEERSIGGSNSQNMEVRAQL